jgi:hypothetical protein
VALLAAITAPADLPAQTSTDIYVGRAALLGGRLRPGMLENITDRDGYDNQPHFTPDGANLLYTSIREDGQADIYRYDVVRGTTTRVTETAESEYSPTVMPGGETFSVVRVEADSTQRLWQLGMEGEELGVLLEEIEPVGYHAWGDGNTVALFILGDPSTLQLANLRSGRAEIIEERIGRSLHKIPRRNAVSFVHIVGQNRLWLAELDLTNNRTRRIVRLLPGNEHYAWSPHRVVVMGQDSKLFQWDSEVGGEWIEVADYARAGIRGISRIALSAERNRIAIVAERP